MSKRSLQNGKNKNITTRTNYLVEPIGTRYARTNYGNIVDLRDDKMFNPQGTNVTLPEVIIVGDKSKDKTPAPNSPYWVAAKTPQLTVSDAMKGVHTAVNPLLAWTSPSQYVGAIRDSKNFKDFLGSMMRGNSGFVTEKYAQEHPLISAGLNLAGDALGTIGAIKVGTKGVNIVGNRIKGGSAINRSKASNTPIFDEQFRYGTADDKLNALLDKKVSEYGDTYWEVKPEYRDYSTVSDNNIDLKLSPSNIEPGFEERINLPYDMLKKVVKDKNGASVLMGETPEKFKGFLKPNRTDWTGWEDYREGLRTKIIEDWNANGPLRSHLERSGITNPETVLDYMMTPQMAWENMVSEGLQPNKFNIKGLQDFLSKKGVSIADEESMNALNNLLKTDKQFAREFYTAVDKNYKNAFASGDGKLYYPLTTTNSDVANNFSSIVSHELGHLEDITSPGFGIVESTQNAYAPTATSPLFKKAFDLGKAGDKSDYFGGYEGSNATEMAQRATQLKDLYRLKSGEKLTVNQIKKAAKLYGKVLPDNDMIDFFNTIKDWNAATKWINAHGKAVLPFIGAGTAYGLSNKKDKVNRRTLENNGKQ